MLGEAGKRRDGWLLVSFLYADRSDLHNRSHVMLMLTEYSH